MTNEKNAPAQNDTVTGDTLEGIYLQLFAEDGDAGADASGGEGAGDNAGTGDGTGTDTGEGDSSADQNDDKPAGAPEEYTDFTAPEGMTFDPESATEFKTLAKELNLTQEQAQKLTDLYGKNMQAMQGQQQAQSEAWATESTKQYKTAEIDLANKTLGRFADKDFVEMLKTTGLGNHPKMIGVFKSIGDQISEGKFVDGQSKQQTGPMFKNSPDMYK